MAESPAVEAVVQAGADGRQLRAARQRTERRRQILDAALRLFAARGYPATGISDIVEAASVARGTFYLYFPSKRAVFDALRSDSSFEAIPTSRGASPDENVEIAVRLRKRA